MISLAIIPYILMVTSNRLKTSIIKTPFVKFGNDLGISFGVINTRIYAHTHMHKAIYCIWLLGYGKQRVHSQLDFLEREKLWVN